MMVVICGVMLVTVSLTFVGHDLRRDSGETNLNDGCRDMADQFFSLGPIYFEGEVLKNSSLGMINASLFHVDAQLKGYCIMLQDLSGISPARVLLQVGEIFTDNDTRSVSAPVLVSMEDLTLHAAKMTVIAW
jgi:hypothetical protein